MKAPRSTINLVESIVDIKTQTKNYFFDFKFVDEKTEKKYMKFTHENKMKLFRISSWITFTFYIFMVLTFFLYFQQKLFFWALIGCSIIDLIISCLISKSIWLKLKSFNHFNFAMIAKFFFMYSSLLAFNMIILSTDFINLHKDHYKLFLSGRLIYIFLILKNVFLLYIPSNLLVIPIFFTVCNNGFLIYLIIILQEEKIYIFLEIIIEILLSFLTIILKLNNEEVSRNNFVQQYKFKKFFNYCNEFIDGLNGFHACFKDKGLVYINKFLRQMLENSNIDIKELKKTDFMEKFKFIKPNPDKDMSNNKIENRNVCLDVKIMKNSKIKNFKDEYSESIKHPYQLEEKNTGNIILIEEEKQSKETENKLIIDYKIEENPKQDILICDSPKMSSDNINLYENSVNKRLNPSHRTQVFNTNLNTIDKLKDLNERESTIKNSTAENHEEYIKNFNLSHEGVINVKLYLLFVSLLPYKVTEDIEKKLSLKDLYEKNLQEIYELIAKDFEESKDFIYIGQFTCLCKIEKSRKYLLVYYRKICDIVDIFFSDNTLNKLAEKSLIEDKIKHNLLAKIAHEFKTPINSILSIKNSIKEKVIAQMNFMKNINIQGDSNNNLGLVYQKFENKILNDLDLIGDLSNYTIYLVSDLIQYASNKVFDMNKNKEEREGDFQICLGNFTQKDKNKISSCELKEKKEMFNLSNQLQFSYRILKALLSCYENKNKSIIPLLEIDPAIKDILVFGDSKPFNQILINLISNSIKFTRSGFIRISCKRDQSNNRLKSNEEVIIITVEDTGLGMSKDILNNILQNKNKNSLTINFDNDVDYNIKGSGLGLSICNYLLNILNFGFEIDSIESKGTRVNIVIPSELIPHSKDDTKIFTERDDMIENDFNFLIPNEKSTNPKRNMKKFKTVLGLMNTQTSAISQTKINETQRFITQKIFSDVLFNREELDGNIGNLLKPNEKKEKIKICNEKFFSQNRLCNRKLINKFYEFYNSKNYFDKEGENKVLNKDLDLFFNNRKSNTLGRGRDINSEKRLIKDQIFNLNLSFIEDQNRNLIRNDSDMSSEFFDNQTKVFNVDKIGDFINIKYEDQILSSENEINKSSIDMERRSDNEEDIKIISKQFSETLTESHQSFIGSSNRNVRKKDKNIGKNKKSQKMRSESNNHLRNEKICNTIISKSYVSDEDVNYLLSGNIPQNKYSICINKRRVNFIKHSYDEKSDFKFIFKEKSSNMFNQNSCNEKLSGVINPHNKLFYNSNNKTISKIYSDQESKLNNYSSARNTNNNIRKFSTSNCMTNSNTSNLKCNELLSTDRVITNQNQDNKKSFTFSKFKNNIRSSDFLETNNIKSHKIVKPEIMGKDFPEDEKLSGRDIKTIANLQENIKIDAYIVVDDNKYIRDAIKVLLLNILEESKNYNGDKLYKIFEVFDGIELLKSVLDINLSNNYNLKLILTDENMEYMNGSSAIKILKDIQNCKKFSSVSIFTVTSFEDDITISNIKKSGVDLILKKPLTKVVLRNSMKLHKII